jgi:hypothetical protein
MRHNGLRAAISVVCVLSAASAAPLACSSSSGSGGDDAGGASEGSTFEAGANDSTSPGEGSTPDARGDAADASAGDGDASKPGDAGISDADAADVLVVDGCVIGSSGEPVDLSCAHLYSDWATKAVYGDVKPYDPGLHLWSDGAGKSRWIHLPAGQTIDTTNMDEWTFPVGTQVWKEFTLPIGPGGAATRIETRLLWKQAASSWYRTTYRWSADGTTSATELTTGELDAGGLGYEVPTQSECDVCHNGRLDGVLGFEAVSLSSPVAAGLNMQALVAQHLLTAPPKTPIVVPGNTIESAALGFLHSNCGTSCHNRGNGAAFYSSFFMRLDVATLLSVQSTDTYATGWNQPSLNFQILDASATYRLHACDLPESCAYYRASRREGLNGTPPGIQMPTIDSHKVDDVDMAALAAWINEGCADAGARD